MSVTFLNFTPWLYTNAALFIYLSKTSDNLPFKCEAYSSILKNFLFLGLHAINFLTLWRIFFGRIFCFYIHTGYEYSSRKSVYNTVFYLYTYGYFRSRLFHIFKEMRTTPKTHPTTFGEFSITRGY